MWFFFFIALKLQFYSEDLFRRKHCCCTVFRYSFILLLAETSHGWPSQEQAGHGDAYDGERETGVFELETGAGPDRRG